LLQQSAENKARGTWRAGARDFLSIASATPAGPGRRTCPRFPWHGRHAVAVPPLAAQHSSLAIARRAAGFPFGAAACAVFATYGK